MGRGTWPVIGPWGAVLPELLDVTLSPDPACECQVTAMNYRAMRIHSNSHFQGGVHVKNEKKNNHL